MAETQLSLSPVSLIYSALSLRWSDIFLLSYVPACRLQLAIFVGIDLHPDSQALASPDGT